MFKADIRIWDDNTIVAEDVEFETMPQELDDLYIDGSRYVFRKARFCVKDNKVNSIDLLCRQEKTY